MTWALPLLIVLQVRSAGVSPRPVVWAAQSPRPTWCGGAPGLWEAPRKALLGRRCVELSRAQAHLLRAPARARELASALLAASPDFVEARTLRGRASLRVGDSAGALADLGPLLATSGAGATDPGALWDGGRAALAQKDVERAAAFYRALGSRAALLPDRLSQVTAYLEIASALLASGSAPADDVLAYLREAKRRSSGTGLSGLVAAITAVTWLGGGRASEAQGALAEVRDAEGLARFRGNQLVWLPDGLLDAALAVSLERAQPELADQHYRALAQTPLGAGKLARLGARLQGAKRGGR